MKIIGLLSDTHGYLDPEIIDFFSDTDEIWHAGDIGSEYVLEQLELLKPVRAVYGNIDDQKIRLRTKEHLIFKTEGIKVWITHIGGYPGKYDPKVKPDIFNDPPKLFISGHSHILKVMNDKTLGLLHINPGAAGNKGIHKVITAVKFEIGEGKISNLLVFEKNRKNSGNMIGW
ncbi:MAG: metallophosphatase family protein [Bacteroidales bacterium]|jgi:putative phosphoesterase|nr:metallophosphatase family protein [Bacteroidales bacterium]